MEVINSEPTSPQENKNKKKRLKKITKIKKLSNPPSEQNLLPNDNSNSNPFSQSNIIQNIEQQQKQEPILNQNSLSLDSNSLNIEPQPQKSKKDLLKDLIQAQKPEENDQNSEINQDKNQSLSELASESEDDLEDEGARATLKKGDKNFSEDSLDESYEMARQQKDKKTKKPLKKENEKKASKKEKKKEDNETYLERLQQKNLFCMEDDDDIENVDGEDIIGLDLLAKEQQKAKEKQERKIRQRKKKEGPTLKNTVKTGNKLFGDISLNDELMNVPQDDEQLVEEECVIGQQLQFEKKEKPKLQLKQTSFFQKMQKVKVERGLQESEKKPREQELLDEKLIEEEPEIEIELNENSRPLEEEKQGNLDQQTILTNKMEEEQDQTQQKMLQKINTLDKVMQEKDQLHLDLQSTAPNNNNQNNNNNNVISSQNSSENPAKQSQQSISDFIKPVKKHIEPKLFSRQKSADQMKLEKNLSSISMENSSQNSTHNDICDIELSIPQFERQNSSQNSITNNTLFVSKFARTSNSQQNIFTSNLKFVSNASNSFSQPQASNRSQLTAFQKMDKGSNINSKQQKGTRDNFLSSILSDINKRKQLSFNEAKESFQKTNFEHINQILKSQKKPKQTQENQVISDEEAENTENDSDFDVNEQDLKKIDNEDQILQKNMENNEQNKQEEILDEEKFRKLIALEEGAIYSESEEEQEQMESEDNNNNENNNNNEEQQLEQINEENLGLDEVLSQPDVENDDVENPEQNSKKKLKKLAQKNLNKQLLLKQEKQKQKEKKIQKKIERYKEQQALLNNPELKEAMGKLYEEEAEQGSDNEENDDNVKKIDRRQELIEAGFNPDEDLDKDLEEIIDRGEVEIDEDAEKLAQERLHRQILKEDKEMLKRIMDGNYRGAQKRRLGLAEQIQEDEQADKKMKRMEEVIKLLEQRDDIEEEYEDYIDDTGKKQKRKRRRTKIDEEEKQMQIKQVELQMKREMEKQEKNIVFDESKFINPKFLDLIRQQSSKDSGALEQQSQQQQQQQKQQIQIQNNNNGNNEEQKNTTPGKSNTNEGIFQNKLNSLNKKHIQPIKITHEVRSTNELFSNTKANNNSILSAINNKNVIGMFKQKGSTQNSDQIINLADKQAQDSALSSLYQDNSNSNTLQNKQNSRKQVTTSEHHNGSKPTGFLGLIKKNAGQQKNKNLVGSSALNVLFSGKGGGILNQRSPNKFMGFAKKREPKEQ